MGIFNEKQEKLGYSVNQLAQASGIAYSYVLKILKGTPNDYQKYGVDILIRLGVALNFSLSEFDDLIKLSGDPKGVGLEHSHYFLSSAEKRKVEGTQAVFDGFSFDNFLLALESEPGNICVVNNKISAIFRPEGYTKELQYNNKEISDLHKIRLKFEDEIILMRFNNFIKKIDDRSYTHIIFLGHLKDYISRAIDSDSPKKAKIYEYHIRRMTEYLGHFNFDLAVTLVEPALRFEILRGREDNKKDHLVTIGGTDFPRSLDSDSGGALLGMSTDNEYMVNTFKAEFDRLLSYRSKELSSGIALKEKILEALENRDLSSLDVAG